MDHIIVFAAQWAAIVTTDASQGGSPSHFRAPPQRYGVEELDVVRFAGKLNVLYMCVRVWQMYDNEKEAFFFVFALSRALGRRGGCGPRAVHSVLQFLLNVNTTSSVAAAQIYPVVSRVLHPSYVHHLIEWPDAGIELAIKILALAGKLEADTLSHVSPLPFPFLTFCLFAYYYLLFPPRKITVIQAMCCWSTRSLTIPLSAVVFSPINCLKKSHRFYLRLGQLSRKGSILYYPRPWCSLSAPRSLPFPATPRHFNG